MLPVHPQPFKGELLSSWMVRLAFANVFPLHTFYSSLLSYKEPIWTLDTDRHPASLLIQILAENTGQSERTLKGMTLSCYEGLLFEALPLHGDAKWLLPAGIYHRTRRRRGLQFCPMCLQGDAEPYYRRAWRLAFCTVCKEHGCLLKENCPRCHAPIAFHLHGIGGVNLVRGNALRFCHLCSFDLGTSVPVAAQWSASLSKTLMYDFLNMLERNEWNGEPLGLCSSLSFFDGLRILIAAIAGRHGKRLRSCLSESIGSSIEPVHGLDFEYQSVDVRHVLLSAVLWLVSDWPSRFLQLCADAGFTRSRFIDHLHLLPYWLHEQIALHLDTRPYLPSLVEITAAANQLVAREILVTTESLGALMGLKKDVARRAILLWEAL